MRAARILAGAAMALATSLAVVAVGPNAVAPAHAVTPGPNGRIAWVDHFSVNTFNPDGTGQTLQYYIGSGADASEYVSAPAWSPDGNRLAFTQYYGAGEGTWLIFGDADSDNWHYVQVGFSSSNPTWSPDGSRIAFDSGGDIFVVDSDGNNLNRLVRNPPAAWGDENPDWSPDGTKILTEYRYNYSDQPRIDVIDTSDGSRTSTGQYGLDPAWSPDGTKIAWAVARGDHDIGLMTASGALISYLTSSTLEETSPTWSPDGTLIAFQSYNGSNPYIRTVNPTTFAQADVGYGAEPNWGANQALCKGHNATITGTSGDDVLRGSAGNDIIQGGAGNDTIIGGGGHDVICGGAGTDTVSYADHAGDVTAVIGDTSLRTEDDIHTDVENLTGGSGDDRLIGNGAANVLNGGRGDDVLKGGDGDDMLYGERGEDELRGGDDRDELTGGLDADLLVGGPGEDTALYRDHTGAVTVTIGDHESNDGNPTDGPRADRDEVLGNVEDVTGTVSGDSLTGNDGDNVINGAAGNDKVVGGEGADKLQGGAGADTLKADDGERDRQIDCGPDADNPVTFDAGLDPAPVSCP